MTNLTNNNVYYHDFNKSSDENHVEFIATSATAINFTKDGKFLHLLENVKSNIAKPTYGTYVTRAVKMFDFGLSWADAGKMRNTINRVRTTDIKYRLHVTDNKIVLTDVVTGGDNPTALIARIDSDANISINNFNRTHSQRVAKLAQAIDELYRSYVLNGSLEWINRNINLGWTATANVYTADELKRNSKLAQKTFTANVDANITLTQAQGVIASEITQALMQGLATTADFKAVANTIIEEPQVLTELDEWITANKLKPVDNPTDN